MGEGLSREASSGEESVNDNRKQAVRCAEQVPRSMDQG